jgi:hypothetical protein
MFISWLAAHEMNSAYKTVGDVGSAWISHLASIPKGVLTTGILLRHPARMLNTRLRVYRDDKSYTEIDRECLKRIEQTWAIPALKCSEMDKIFLQDLYNFRTQIEALGSVDVVMQLERLNSDVDYCEDVLHRLTGLYYERSLIEPMVRNPVNRRTEKGVSLRTILGGFTEQQQAWYRLLLQDSISSAGYDLEDDLPEQRPPLQGRSQHGDPTVAKSGHEEVGRLKQMLADKDREIARLRTQVEELEGIWNAVQASAGWRLINQWREVSRRLVPAGTLARRIYNLLLRRFRGSTASGR